MIMDNLSSYKDLAIWLAIRSADAKLFYLPSYSPDLNPTKLKTLFCKESARSRRSNARSASC